MEIYLVQERKLLHVHFDNAEFTAETSEGGPFKRQFGDPQHLTFTFEMTTANVFALFVSFSRYKEPAVLSRIADGRAVDELQTLVRLADLPRARIFGSMVLLPDGRSVELIDTVGFELRKVWAGAWESEKNETEVNRRLRKMRLNRLRDELPGIFGDPSRGPAVAAGKELLFSDVSDAESRLQDRDPNELAHCDKCEELFYEHELTEIRPGFFSCPDCLPKCFQETGLVFVPEKPPAPDMRAGSGCSSSGDDQKDREFKKPTAEDINKAIQLLLWRCRDAEIYAKAPEGKRGYYQLDDWIARANDDMIRELGLWCADIQELNTGSRDS